MYQKHGEGYCISTIEKENLEGEIDSIYVEDELRGSGTGTKLIEKSIKWFRENECSCIKLAVADGHESVIEFYKKIGCYPKLTLLQMKTM